MYGHAKGTDRILPFDLVPRIIPADDWRRIDVSVEIVEL